MNQEPIKICSKCGAEYSLMAEICADCGGDLVSPQDYEARSIPLTEDDEQVFIREGAIDYLKKLGNHLRQNGIRATILLHGGTPGSCPSGVRFGLYVAAGDEESAKEIDRAYWLAGAPDHASSFRYTEQELSGTCPACSCAIPEGAATCPECGLVVKAEEELATCPDCDAEVGDDVDKFPNCGAEFE
jgi:predicted amidophosphoribosyltransferase